MMCLERYGLEREISDLILYLFLHKNKLIIHSFTKMMIVIEMETLFIQSSAILVDSLNNICSLLYTQNRKDYFSSRLMNAQARK